MSRETPVAHAVEARPWRLAFPNLAHWDRSLQIETIPELLDRAVTEHADRPALEFRDRQLTYRALSQAADQVAAGLLAMGIGKGDAVALYLPNTPWHPVSFFALVRTGACIVNLSPLDSPRELAHKLRDSGARTLITIDAGLFPMAVRLLDDGHVDRVLVGEVSRWGESTPGPIPWSERVRPLPEAEPPPEWPKLTPDDLCLLQYTGGTTGPPKGAMLSHGNLTAAVSMYRLWHNGLAPQGRQRVVAVLPLFHIYALTTVLLRHISEGDELLLRPRFDVDTLLQDIAGKRATIFAGVPTMWIALLSHPAAATCDYASLQGCFSGGAPMPFEVQQEVERLVGLRLLGGWGMTETSPAGTRLPRDAEPSPGQIGVPLPGIDLRIVDREDPSRELPPGQVGELAVRGPNVFRGYWNRPEETAAAFHDGWFLTGDLGRMDARGVFSILDRKKNMIISSGFNVYPAAVESAIHEHPDVEEAAVIGIPDGYRGQAAKAFVTLRPGAAPLSLSALRAFLAERLGKHEMPAALEIRQSLPRSPAGKLLHQALIEEARTKVADAKGPQS